MHAQPAPSLTMPKLLFGVLGLCLLVVSKVFGSEVAIGVFAYQGERAAADWSPVIRYLNQALPEHHFRLDQYDAAGLRQAIAGHQVDLVITNPGYYVSMEAAFGISRIATLDTKDDHPARALGSVVLARADRTNLHTLADLAGKRVAAVAPEAFGGFLVAAREMLDQGVDPDSDLMEIQFVGLPMIRIIEAVQRGDVDAGIVRACLPEQLARQGKIRFEDFRVLSGRQDADLACALSTRLYPNWPIAVTRQTDPVLAKAVARALLSMPESDGMSWSVPADYQPVHDLFRKQPSQFRSVGRSLAIRSPHQTWYPPQRAAHRSTRSLGASEQQQCSRACGQLLVGKRKSERVGHQDEGAHPIALHHGS